MSSFGSSASPGDPAKIQAQASEDQARLSFMQSGLFQASAQEYQNALGQRLREFDVGAQRAVGSTALQLARSGNMTRSHRDVVYDEAMGMKTFTAGEGYGEQAVKLEARIEELTEKYEELKGLASGGAVREAEKAVREMEAAMPQRGDFTSTDHDKYQDALSDWQGCIEEEREEESARADRAASQYGATRDAQGNVIGFGDGNTWGADRAASEAGATRDASGNVIGL